MEKQLFPLMSPQERLQMIQDNCDQVEKQSYMKQFTHEEIRLMKDRLAEVSIDLSEIDSEKQEIVDKFKQKAKPLKTELSGLLGNIKQKAIAVNEDCYKFIDHQEGSVGYYSASGDLVFERPIYHAESQKTIFPIQRTGSED